MAQDGNPKDAAVSHPPSSEQSHDDDAPERTPGLGAAHIHRLQARTEED